MAPPVVTRLLDVVGRLAASGVGVLLIGQFTNLALGLRERVHVMNRGCISFFGSAQDTRSDPTILHDADL